MGMSKQDLARILKSIRALMLQPVVTEALVQVVDAMLIPSDDEETMSESGLKFQRPLLLEGSNSVCQSFWDSSYRHTTYSLAHNIFEGDLQCLLNQDMSSVQEDICAFLHKAEISRLTSELAEMEKLRRSLKEEEVEEKEKAWKEHEERYANEVATTNGVGFEVTLEQIRLLCHSADLSGMDTRKVVIDGNLVDG
ncbi:hypothetical protein DEO72_LG2g5612 [Vigna unguiculata]|uniref:Uncharacterized protein n=1 Tax=Vigna unguiculata TaxID=3917 RepID=A0A4D6L9Q8_VIGUN|nr:hypothetical protein DEO72_LG2g5612 [Vigna unguiculata]